MDKSKALKYAGGFVFLALIIWLIVWMFGNKEV